MDNQINIENAILNSFLDLDAHGMIGQKTFKLDIEAFMYPFNKKVAERINEFLEEGKTPYLLSFLIEESVEGTRYESDYLDIITTTPLLMIHAKQFHDELVLRKFKRMKNAR